MITMTMIIATTIMEQTTETVIMVSLVFHVFIRANSFDTGILQNVSDG